jgi:hypothetical protein
MFAIQIDDVEIQKDKKIAVLSTAVSLVLFVLLAYFTTFLVNPPLPIDLPPLKSDEVIEMFEIDNVEIVKEGDLGGQGGGTPSDDRIDKPQEQSENFLTSHSNPAHQIFSGKSDNHNTPNNNTNSSSSTSQSNNPFGSGGTGGKGGAGSGGPFGNGVGPSGSGPGGTGNGEGRTRLNNVSIDHIESDRDETIVLKLTVDANGTVVSAISTSKTTTTDARIINQVKAAVISQVKYSKSPGSGPVQLFYTVKIDGK